MPIGLPARLSGRRWRADHPAHGAVALVEEPRHRLGVAIEPSVSCVRSFEPIEKPSKTLQELFREDHVRRESRTSRTPRGHPRPDATRSRPCTASTRRPSSTVRQNGIMILTFASPMSWRTRRSAWHSSAKPSCVARVVVARRAAEADHRVLFGGLELASAQQRRVLVGLEVARPHDDRLRVEGGGDAADALARGGRTKNSSASSHRRCAARSPSTAAAIGELSDSAPAPSDGSRCHW